MDSRPKTIYPRAMFRTGAQMSILALLTGMFLFWASAAGPVNSFERKLQLRMGALLEDGRHFGESKGWLPHRSTAPVCLVAINDNSVANHPWPWTPLDFSLFAQSIVPFKPEVVAIDEVLDWDRSGLAPTERQKLPQYEKILHDSLLRCPKLLLASDLGYPDDPNSIPPLREAPLIRRVTGSVNDISEWSAIEQEAKEEFRLAATVGFRNLLASPAENAIPLFYRFQGRIVPSLALQAVVLWQKLSLDDVSIVAGSHVALGDRLRIPINRRGEMLVNVSTPFLHIGYDELLLASEQVAAGQKTIVPVDRVAHSVALLARSDKGEEKLQLGDGRFGTGGEFIAAAIATIQAQAFLKSAPTWLPWAIIGTATLLSAGVPAWKRKQVTIGTLIILFGYACAAGTLLARSYLLLPLLLPAGLALFIIFYRLATPNHVWRLRRPVIF